MNVGLYHEVLGVCWREMNGAVRRAQEVGRQGVHALLQSPAIQQQVRSTG